MALLLKESGIRSAAAAVQSVALNAATWRVIANPNPTGYRRAGGFSCIPDYRKAAALAQLLGIHAPVLYLGHIAVEGPLYNVRPGTKPQANRPWNKPLSTHVPQVLADLRALDGRYAECADPVEALSQGRTAYDPDGMWLQPVIDLLHAEKDRLIP